MVDFVVCRTGELFPRGLEKAAEMELIDLKEGFLSPFPQNEYKRELGNRKAILKTLPLLVLPFPRIYLSTCPAYDYLPRSSPSC